MKVKVGELKTHLSRYLSKLQHGGESIEVCVREEPVAYLIPISSDGSHPKEDAGMRQIRERLQRDGVCWDGHPGKAANAFKPEPVPAHDGLTDVDTTERMRMDRDW